MRSVSFRLNQSISPLSNLGRNSNISTSRWSNLNLQNKTFLHNSMRTYAVRTTPENYENFIKKNFKERDALHPQPDTPDPEKSIPHPEETKAREKASQTRLELKENILVMDVDSALNEYLSNSGGEPDVRAFNVALEALADQGKYEKVVELFNKMQQDWSVLPNANSVASVIRVTVMHGTEEEQDRLLERIDDIPLDVADETQTYIGMKRIKDWMAESI